VQVFHHIGTHGTRYNIDFSHAAILDGLVDKGREKIKAWMVQNGVSESEIARFESGQFSQFPLQDIN